MSKSPVLYGVYAAEFPFLESNRDKIRPVIVISEPVGKHGVIAVVPVSSKMDKQSVDRIVASWNEAGLLRPSVARVHRLSTMLQSRLSSYLGTLSVDDSRDLKISLRKFLSL